MKKPLLCFISLCTVFGFLMLAYGIFYEPNSLKITRYTIKNHDLAGIKIAFASDFHISPRHQNRLNKIITAINNEKPDIIILGGDYVKGHKKTSTMPIEDIAASLSNLKSTKKTFAVLGNHDVWYGKNEVISAFQNAGITVLDNQNHHLSVKEKDLTILGIADYSSDKPDLLKTFNQATAPAILVSHSPDIFPLSPKTALTLAGHTHGGQIRFPVFGAPLIPSKYGKRYRAGLIRENAKIMIISQGLGTSILPIRFNCPPEIVIITFR